MFRDFSFVILTVFLQNFAVQSAVRQILREVGGLGLVALMRPQLNKSCEGWPHLIAQEFNISLMICSHLLYIKGKHL